MLTQNTNEPKAQNASNSNNAQPTGAVLDPHSPIEVGTGGDGTTNDQAGKDTRPPYSDPAFLP